MENEKKKEENLRERVDLIYRTFSPDCKMVISFLSYRDRKVSGYIRSVYYDNKSFYFTGLDHLLLIMEDIMDRADYPQTSVDYRNLKGKTFRRQADIFEKEDNKETISLFEDQKTEDMNLKKNAVSVLILSRRNSSIQGELTIGAANKVYFRSGIELIQFLYEYLDEIIQ